MVAPATGRPRKLVLQTFRLYEDEIRRVDSLKGFRRVQTIMGPHLPAVRDGDRLQIDAPGLHLQGTVTILEHRHIKVSSGMRTVMAIWLEQEVGSE